MPQQLEKKLLACFLLARFHMKTSCRRSRCATLKYNKTERQVSLLKTPWYIPFYSFLQKRLNSSFLMFGRRGKLWGHNH